MEGGLNFIRIIIKLAVVGVILYALWQVALPYKDNYFLTVDVRKGAANATRYDVESSKKYLKGLTAESGWMFDESDFDIRKEGKAATVIVEYVDEISVFGYVFKELHFKISETKNRDNY